jgi:hypothetical protein
MIISYKTRLKEKSIAIQVQRGGDGGLILVDPPSPESQEQEPINRKAPRSSPVSEGREMIRGAEKEMGEIVSVGMVPHTNKKQ